MNPRETISEHIYETIIFITLCLLPTENRKIRRSYVQKSLQAANIYIRGLAELEL